MKIKSSVIFLSILLFGISPGISKGDEIVSSESLMAECSSPDFLSLPITWKYGQAASLDLEGKNDDRNMFPYAPLDYQSLNDLEKARLEKINKFNDGIGLSQIKGAFGTCWRDGRWGSDIVVADLKGPGAITVFWSTVGPANWYYCGADGRVKELEKTAKNQKWNEDELKDIDLVKERIKPEPEIEFYFDGESSPRIKMKILDFFGGKAPFEGLSGGNPCAGGDPAVPGYFNLMPMPFKKSVKIIIRNKAPNFYYNIKYRKYPEGTDVKTFSISELDKSALAKFAEFCRTGNLAGREQEKCVGKDIPLKDGVLYSSDKEQMISRMNLTLKDIGAVLGREDIRLKIFWDGEKEASVDSPLGFLFGLVADGENVPKKYSSPIFARDGNVLSFCLPIPCESSKILLSLPEGMKELDGKLDVFALNIGDASKRRRLVAVYRHEIVPHPRRPVWEFAFPNENKAFDHHLFVKGIKGEGAYVGTLLNIKTPSDVAWEGDEIGWIDGETIPSVFGTGTEDYFFGAWYNYPKAGAGMPLAAQLNKIKSPIGDGYDSKFWGEPPWDKNFKMLGAYRLHLMDPIVFRESLTFGIERGSANTHPGDYQSLALIYINKQQ